MPTLPRSCWVVGFAQIRTVFLEGEMEDGLGNKPAEKSTWQLQTVCIYLASEGFPRPLLELCPGPRWGTSVPQIPVPTLQSLATPLCVSRNIIIEHYLVPYRFSIDSKNTWFWMTLNGHFALNSVLCRYVWTSEVWLSKPGYSKTCNECRRRTLNRKEQLRHRAVSLRQHGSCIFLFRSRSRDRITWLAVDDCEAMIDVVSVSLCVRRNWLGLCDDITKTGQNPTKVCYISNILDSSDKNTEIPWPLLITYTDTTLGCICS